MTGFDFIDYLRTEKGLNNYQIGKIQELLDSFVQNDSSNAVAVEICPKCGKLHPHVIRSGFAGSGKQLYRCMECSRRFISGNTFRITLPSIRLLVMDLGMACLI